MITKNRQQCKFWFLDGTMERKTKISTFVTISYFLCESHWLMPRDNNNIGVVRLSLVYWLQNDISYIQPPVTPVTFPKKGAAVGHTLQVILRPIYVLGELVPHFDENQYSDKCELSYTHMSIILYILWHKVSVFHPCLISHF